MGDGQTTDARGANNFGILRLLFAALVIVSHSPEILDGNRFREPLTRLFGTMSFGEVAVDGFFLISGFLITGSWARAPKSRIFLPRRIGRILPGYLVAFALSFFVLAPLVGATEPTLSLVGVHQFISQTAHLLPPDVPGVFEPLHYHALNGSMWTIAYEARCYVAVLVIGSLGIRAVKGVPVLAVAVLVALLVDASGILSGRHISPFLERNLGDPAPSVRFAAAFGVGALFFLLQHRIALTWQGAMIAALALLASMPFSRTAEAGFLLCGGYLVFFAAFRLPTSPLSRWTDRTDISYGLYLYAWPIGSTAVFLWPGIKPWELCALTLPLAAACGAVSWFTIERPSLDLVRLVSGRPDGEREGGRPQGALASS